MENNIKTELEKAIAENEPMSTFEILNSINVNENVEQKGKLTYLSWTWAWQELKKVDPLAFYTVYENAEGWNYHTDRVTCWVKVGVSVHYVDAFNPDRVDLVEHIEYLPVMDYKNASIDFEKVTSMDVNKAIQRAITKAIARHGLGLYIYAGEDLPDVEKGKARDLATAKDELTAFCNQFGEDIADKVWKKYGVGEMTEPEDVRKILEKYKTEAAKKASKAKPEEDSNK